MKFDVLDMIREPDNYTSGERAQASEAVAGVIGALVAIRDAGNDFAEWHPKFHDAIALARAALAKIEGGAE